MLKVNGNEVFPYKNAAFHKRGSIEQGKRDRKGRRKRDRNKRGKMLSNRQHFDKYICGRTRVLSYFPEILTWAVLVALVRSERKKKQHEKLPKRVFKSANMKIICTCFPHYLHVRHEMEPGN